MSAGRIADHVGPAPLRSLLSLRPMREAWIDGLIGVVCILPLLLTAHLPLADLPSHMALQYIIRDWASSPYLQTFHSTIGRSFRSLLWKVSSLSRGRSCRSIWPSECSASLRFYCSSSAQVG
jgi:hypothetical protein